MLDYAKDYHEMPDTFMHPSTSVLYHVSLSVYVCLYLLTLLCFPSAFRASILNHVIQASGKFHCPLLLSRQILLDLYFFCIPNTEMTNISIYLNAVI